MRIGACKLEGHIRDRMTDRRESDVEIEDTDEITSQVNLLFSTAC